METIINFIINNGESILIGITTFFVICLLLAIWIPEELRKCKEYDEGLDSIVW